MHFKSKNGNDNHLVFKLGVSFVVASLYFIGICFLSRYSYPNCLFFDPGFALFPAFLTSCVIIFCSFIETTRMYVWLKANKKRLIIVIVILAILFVSPIAFLKSGIVADEKGIYKKNLFGETIKEYAYSDIVSFEMSVQHGIQYDVNFYSGDSIFLMSHQVIMFNSFGNDYNMMMMDQILAQHSKRKVVHSYRSSSENIKRFFKEEEVFQYFDQIFQQSYSIS